MRQICSQMVQPGPVYLVPFYSSQRCRGHQGSLRLELALILDRQRQRLFEVTFSLVPLSKPEGSQRKTGERDRDFQPQTLGELKDMHERRRREW